MTEYWKSQAKKFCDFCKCWISDNKASVEFHESGKRHQTAVQTRLEEIGRKGAADERQKQKQELWLQKMEAAAMKDYRSKDLEEGGHADMTAQNFQAKRAQRDENAVDRGGEGEGRFDDGGESSRARMAAAKAGFSTASTSRDPMLECIPDRPPPQQDDSGDEGGGGSQAKQGKLERVEAPKGGTKYHKPEDAKKWFEAKSEDGTIYYWHVETHQSRWQPPPEGYLSIKDQEEINKKHEEREMKKYNRIVEQQSIHSHAGAFSATAAAEAAAGTAPKADPYGSGGWQKVAKKTDVIDYQAVDTTAAKSSETSSSVTLHDDRLKKFETKKTPKISDDFEADLDAGIVDNSKSTKPSRPPPAAVTAAPSKPAIVFRKRKANPDRSVRKPEDQD